MDDADTVKALVVGVIVGYIVLYFVNYRPFARQSGKKPPLQALLFFNNNACYHIHHYMYMLPLAAALWSLKLGETVVGAMSGFLIGGSLEELMFGDWRDIKGHCANKRARHILKISDDHKPDY